jgi:hypothetical protein
MPRKNTKQNTEPVEPDSVDQHLETLGQLLSLLKKHLTSSQGKKGTYGDYLRLLEFYRETRGRRPTELFVSWVDSEQFLKDSPVVNDSPA